jgi:hypothetical protein
LKAWSEPHVELNAIEVVDVLDQVRFGNRGFGLVAADLSG